MLFLFKLCYQLFSPSVFIFSSCHFPYGCMNFPLLGDDYVLRDEIFFYLSTKLVIYLNHLLFISFKEEHEQLTQRYKQYVVIA